MIEANKIPAIKVEQVSKHFKLPHQKSNSLKSSFTNIASYVKSRNDFEIQQALSDISFQINQGEFFGIVGRNGSGKSTLLKILAGIYQPNEGKVTVNGRLVPFIELGVGFNGELTGRENVYLSGALMGFSKNEVDALYEDIVSFAELKNFMDQKLKNYSSGMQVRLAFSLAIRASADVLLVDEVLAVGDADFQKKCFRYFRALKKQGKTVVFVSHDMNAIQEYCDRAILIEKSKLVLEGTPHEVSTAYTRMFAEQGQEVQQKNKKTNKRWGNKKVVFTSVELSPDQMNKKDERITITAKAVVKKDADEAIIGFKIRGHEEGPILGTNTKIKKQDLRDLKKGQKITVSWQVPNVFNDGEYMVDLAIEGQDYSDVYDWWEDADHFYVERQEDNPYGIHPFININTTLK